MSRDRAFKNLFWGFLELVKVWTFKTILKICYKSSLIYLEIESLEVRMIIIKKFALGNSVSWSYNLLSNLENREKLKKVTKRRSLQKQSWP